MSLLQKDSRTAFSGEAADGNISSGMFVCNCISYYGITGITGITGSDPAKFLFFRIAGSDPDKGLFLWENRSNLRYF